MTSLAEYRPRLPQVLGLRICLESDPAFSPTRPYRHATPAQVKAIIERAKNRAGGFAAWLRTRERTG